MQLFQELKRRQVFQVAIAYCVVAWAVLEVGDLLFDALEVPAWGMRLLLGLLLLGFPIALLFSWIYRMDADGIHLEDGDDDLLEAPEPAPVAAIPDDLSIAVLPFDDLSADQDQEYFGDGIAEEMLNLLARVDGLRVLARTSSFAFRGRGMTADAIARELKVAYILEGSIRKSGSRLRVTAQLIQARDSSHLFSESYDRDLEDIFAVQDEIARTVTRKLQLRLLEKAPEARDQELLTEGHDLYMQGTHKLWQGSLQSLREGIDLFTRATEADPNNANAHALLAYAYMLSCADPQADRKLDSALPQIRAGAQRALELDPRSEQANLSMAMYKMAVQEWADSERYFLRSISINPSQSQAYGYYGYFLANTRRMEEGLQQANRAVALDPLNTHELVRKAQLASYTGDQETALACARRALELQPDFGTAHLWLVGIYGQMGDHEAAIDSMTRWNLVDMRLSQREAEEFRHALREQGVAEYLAHWYRWLCKKKQRGARSPHLDWFLGLYALLNGKVDAALDHLQEAWTQTLLVPDLVFFSGLRDNPRWQAMLSDHGLDDAAIDSLRIAAQQCREELGLQRAA